MIKLTLTLLQRRFGDWKLPSTAYDLVWFERRPWRLLLQVIASYIMLMDWILKIIVVSGGKPFSCPSRKERSAVWVPACTRNPLLADVAESGSAQVDVFWTRSWNLAHCLLKGALSHLKHLAVSTQEQQGRTGNETRTECAPTCTRVS